MQLISAGCPEVTFPRMAVFNWGAKVVHAVLMILCRAEPGSPVRLLRDENGLYTAEYASKVLLESFQALYHTQEERQAVVVRLLQNCYEKQDLIIEEAKAFGYDPMQVEDKVPLTGGGKADSKNGMQVNTTETLCRQSTEEELEQLKTKQQLLQVQREMLKEQNAMAAASSEDEEVGKDTSAQHKQEAAAKQQQNAKKQERLMSTSASELKGERVAVVESEGDTMVQTGLQKKKTNTATENDT